MSIISELGHLAMPMLMLRDETHPLHPEMVARIFTRMMRIAGIKRYHSALVTKTGKYFNDRYSCETPTWNIFNLITLFTTVIHLKASCLFISS